MSPRKLSDADKQEILKLYRQSEETTSTLATRYGVSSSTISRFLKSNLSESEYEELIQQKRLARTPNREKQLELILAEEFQQLEFEQPDVLPQEVTPSRTDDEKEVTTSVRWRRRRSSAPSSEEEISPPILAPQPEPEEVTFPEKEEELFEVEQELDRSEAITLGEMLGEYVEEDEDEDEDEEDTDEDEWEEEEEEEVERKYVQVERKKIDVKVLPLSQASFPKICYLVIDRTAELITRPLKEFADLGAIPDEEVQQKTLPVFDNHRVARRFSHRSQRVIKIPDGRMLQKASSYLKAKGITRLLIDGQIYSLSSL